SREIPTRLATDGIVRTTDVDERAVGGESVDISAHAGIPVQQLTCARVERADVLPWLAEACERSADEQPVCLRLHAGDAVRLDRRLERGRGAGIETQLRDAVAIQTADVEEGSTGQQGAVPQFEPENGTVAPRIPRCDRIGVER